MQVGVFEVRDDAHQDHVGLFQVLAALAVVVADGVVERVHAVEIVVVEPQVGARPGVVVEAPR